MNEPHNVFFIQKGIKNRQILAFFCLFWGIQVNAQVGLSADSNHVETGNLLALYVDVPEGMGPPDTLQLAQWSAVIDPKNILNQSPWMPTGTAFRKTISVLFFEADTILIPPLPLLFSGGDTLFTNGLNIVVMATPAPEQLTDMAPIKEIHREPTLWVDYLPWILGGLAVLGIIGLFFWLANGRAAAKIKHRSIAIPAHELALKKLQVLAQKDLINKGLVKEYYTELTDILREYLANRFEIPAIESTTEETIQALSSTAFPTADTPMLEYVLSQADEAKFAQWVPADSFYTESWAFTHKIIAESRPKTQSPT